MIRTLTRCLPLVLMAATLTACGQKDAFDLGNTEGDPFSNPDRSTRLQDLESQYGLKIIITDRSYNQEHATNRVLRFLVENLATYADKLKSSGVIEIEIGHQFSTAEVPGSAGKYRVTLNNFASETQMHRYMERYAQDIQSATRLSTGASRIGIKYVFDLHGMSPTETNEFMDRAESAARGLDFQAPLPLTIHQMLAIERIYAVGVSSMYVPYDATADGLHAYFEKILALSKHLTTDLARATTATGLSVSYQDGVLTPDELTQGIENLVARSAQIRAAAGVKHPILIGRRTETDSAMIRSESKILISFSATAEEVAAVLALLDADATSGVQKALADFRAEYLASGVEALFSLDHFGFASGIPTPTTLEQVARALSRIKAVAAPTRLARLNVRTLQSAPTYSSSTSGPAWLEERTGGVLILNTRVDNALSEDALAAVLNPLEGRFERAFRLQTQRGMIDGHWAQGGYRTAGLTLEAPDAVLDTSTAEKTMTLNTFLAAFKTIAAATRLRALQLRRVVFVRGVASEREFVITGGDFLQVDPYQATPAQLEQALYDLEHPAPAPVPRPRP